MRKIQTKAVRTSKRTAKEPAAKAKDTLAKRIANLKALREKVRKAELRALH